jgi:hypothetical protein
MGEAVIRVTSRIYHKGTSTKEVYTDRAVLSADSWFTYAARVEWAVLLLSGVKDYTTGSRFKAWRPSIPGTDGSDRSLHYVDTYPYQLNEKALAFDIIEPDPEERNVWIARAWLESGFTAADRRRIYAALKQLAVARHWHEPRPIRYDPYGSGERVHVLETGNLPGW